MHHIKFCRKKSVVRNLHHVWQNGVGGKSIEVRKGEYFSFKVFGSQRRKERKKETLCGSSCTNSLFPLISFQFGKKEKCEPNWKQSINFPFPHSISLQPNKGFFLSSLPFPSPIFTFSPSSLNPDKVLVKVFKVLG